MDEFSDKLASLCSREMVAAKTDPDRSANMVERLAHSLAFTIAIVAGGDPSRASTLTEGAIQYLVDDAAGMHGIGKAVDNYSHDRGEG